MLITLEPHGLFCSNFVYIYLNIVQSMVCETVTRLDRALFWLSVLPSAVISENAYNSWTAWNILMNLSTSCITTFFDGRGFAEYQLIINFWSVTENAHNSWFPRYNWFKLCILCILKLSNNWYGKRGRGFIKQHFGRSSSFGENDQNSWTAWYIWFKFCTLMYLNIVKPLVWKNVTRLHWASFWPVKLFWWKCSY